jgi:hypothetical protein
MLVWLLHLCFVFQTGTSFNFKHNRQLTHKRNTEARSRNHCYHAKAMCYIFCVCICSLSYLARKAHAPYCTVICGLSRSTILSTLSHKRYDFRKNVIKQKCVLIFSTNSVWNVSHSKRISAAYYHKCTHRICLYIKCPLLLSYFNKNLNLLHRFSKNTQISNFMNICSMGAELFRADGRTYGQTDRHRHYEANSSISQFCGHA